MNVDGDRLYLDSAKHLTNQSLFQEECVKQLRFNPPTLKTNDWKKLTNILLENAEVTEPAEGTGTKDILRNYLEDYCVNRIQKDDYEDLKNGGTYTKKVIITLCLITFFTTIYQENIGRCHIKEHHKC